jgi:tetratricopeptide (TPR) repeat protein
LSKKTKEIIESLYDQAKELIEKGEHLQAIPFLERVLELEPEHHYAIYELAISYYTTEEYNKGIIYCRKAIKLGFDDFSITHRLATMLAKLQKYDQAREVALQALKIDSPENECWHTFLARICEDQGDLNTAINHMHDAIRSNPFSKDLRYSLGLYEMKLGKYDDAFLTFRGIEQDCTSPHPHAWYQMAKIFAIKGLESSAFELLQKAITDFYSSPWSDEISEKAKNEPIFKRIIQERGLPKKEPYFDA